MIRQFWSIMTESVRSNANTVRYVDPCSRGFDLRVFSIFVGFELSCNHYPNLSGEFPSVVHMTCKSRKISLANACLVKSSSIIRV